MKNILRFTLAILPVVLMLFAAWLRTETPLWEMITIGTCTGLIGAIGGLLAAKVLPYAQPAPSPTTGKHS